MSKSRVGSSLRARRRRRRVLRCPRCGHTARVWLWGRCTSLFLQDHFHAASGRRVAGSVPHPGANSFCRVHLTATSQCLGVRSSNNENVRTYVTNMARVIVALILYDRRTRCKARTFRRARERCAAHTCQNAARGVVPRSGRAPGPGEAPARPGRDPGTPTATLRAEAKPQAVEGKNNILPLERLKGKNNILRRSSTVVKAQAHAPLLRGQQSSERGLDEVPGGR